VTTVIETDALVVGAGPVGLFQVFQLGLQGIRAHVVDVLDVAGGQCVELYPDKPIYDIPGVPLCTGRELTDKLLRQIKPFAPGFHFGQLVSALTHQSDGRWHVTTHANNQLCQHFLTRTLFIAAGVGAFLPKELKVDGLAVFAGKQLFYQTRPASAFLHQHVVIAGGEAVAVAHAIALTEVGPAQASSVTVVHRRDVLQASADDLARFAVLRQAGVIRFQTGQITGIQTEQGCLRAVLVTTPHAQVVSLPLDVLLVCSGISPKLGPIMQWGLAMERKQLCVSTDSFATSEPGIFAVGDIISYPGKKKLLVCGFHEATLAAFAAAKLINPDDSGVLQYTTSSALLQRRLGVQEQSGVETSG